MENQRRRESTGAQAGRVADLLQAVYQRLLAHYGPQDWWPADTPFEVIVGAILVQAVAWPNVEMDPVISLDRQTRSGLVPEPGRRRTA
jgi:hypothetical protein